MDERRDADMVRRMQRTDQIENDDEKPLLNFVEVLLKHVSRKQTIEMFVQSVVQQPELVMAYINVSKKDRLVWQVLTLLLRQLRLQQVPIDFSNEQECEQWEAARRALNAWAVDAHVGILKEPRPRGRDKRWNGLRDAGIAVAVNEIKNLGARPATSNRPGRSACHAVANRIGLSYEAVCTIWQNNRDLFQE